MTAPKNQAYYVTIVLNIIAAQQMVCYHNLNGYELIASQTRARSTPMSLRCLTLLHSFYLAPVMRAQLALPNVPFAPLKNF